MTSLKFRGFYLFFILAVVGISVGATSIIILYETHTREELERLTQIAQKEARLFEAIAEFDSRQSPDYPGGPLEATISQFREALSRSKEFGLTGELLLGKMQNDKIVFILSHTHSGLIKLPPVPKNSPNAEPMRRALNGESGSIIAHDYRGEKVLAAYEPIRILNYGIVIKVGLDEHRWSFIQAGFISAGIGLVIILIGGLLFFRETESFVTNIEEKNARLEDKIRARVTAIQEEKKTSEMLRTIAEIANYEKKFDQAIEKSLKIFCNYLGWEIGHIYYVDHVKKLLIPRKIWYLDDAEKFSKFTEVTESRNFTLGEGLPGKVVSSGHMMWIEDIYQDIAFVRAQHGDLGVVTGMAFPIISQEKLVGVLEFYTTKKLKIKPELKPITANIGNLLGQIFERLQLDQMKTEFISTVAHELRTPLTSIQGYSELLQMRPDIEKQEKDEFLSYIHKESIALTNIINDLLDISHIESSQGFSIKKKNTSIQEIFKECIDIFQGVSAEHQLTLTLNISDDEWFIDEDKMRQVLNNIYSNAIKYSPEGGLIETVIRDSPTHIIVSVKDHGLGMSPQNLSKIFEKFYRADSSNTAIEGTGLGTTIMKYLIEAHNGSIELQSKLGKGTEVIFSIPKESYTNLHS